MVINVDISLKFTAWHLQQSDCCNTQLQERQMQVTIKDIQYTILNGTHVSDISTVNCIRSMYLEGN